MTRPAFILRAGLVLLALSLGAAVSRSTALSQAPFQLRLPLDCQVGATCLIQQYPDDDPGPGAKDYACGSRTYDGHDGTDFRVPSTAARLKGIPVLAAAGGVVKGGRDGIEDRDARTVPPEAIKNLECGNGVLIDNGDGWDTQYCHMEKGSVIVRPGDHVTAGQKLGLVGESGDADFPHLHLTVRKDGHWVDPFAYGAKPGECRGGRSLFDPQTTALLAYKSPDLLNMGFATEAPTMDTIEAGLPAEPALPANAPALIFYARVIGLEPGDILRLALKGPDGAILAGSATPPMPRSEAEYFVLDGKRAKGPWPPGRYGGTVEVVRAGKIVLTRQDAVAVR